MIQYFLEKISKKKRLEFFLECKDLSTDVKITELDVESSGWQRKATDKTFDDIINMCKSKDKHFETWTLIDRTKESRFHPDLEVALTVHSLGASRYYVFLFIPIDKLDYLVTKYKIPSKEY